MTTAPRRAFQAVPTFVSLVCFITVVALGSWQIIRLEWKESLLEEITAKLAQPPEMLQPAMLVPDEEVSAHGFYYIRASLMWVGKPLLMAAKYHRGQLGYHVLQPAKTADGAVVLVNRGWVPEKEHDLFAKAPAAGTTLDLVGMLRPLPKRGWFTPDNQAKDNMWFWYDADRMASAAEMPSPPAVVVEAVSKTASMGEEYPVPAKAEVKLRNDHLAYAVTWFALAVVIVVIFLLYHRASPLPQES